MVIVSPLLSVIVRSVCGALSTLALIVAVPVPSSTVTSLIVTVVTSIVSLTTTSAVSVVSSDSKFPPVTLAMFSVVVAPSMNASSA